MTVYAALEALKLSDSEERREIIKADLLGKFQREDWHGVMDCAADLRDHDEYQKGLLAGLRAESPYRER